MEIKILDTTLRDGEQAPGVYFTTEEKFQIVNFLFDAGVSEIEAGIPFISDENFKFIKEIIEIYPYKDISTWSRLKLNDLEITKKCGVKIIHISVPVSEILYKSQIGEWNDVKARLKTCLDFAILNFSKISLGLQDIFRSNLLELEEILEIANKYQIYRIKISDTVGYALPYEVKEIISFCKTKYKGLIGFHGHNDIGLATANSLTAIESGATFIDTTVNGLGERAGNTALEEISFILNKHHNYSSNIDLKKLKPLSKYVSKASGRDLPDYKPITGEKIFLHESGIHCRELLKNPLSYQPFIPEQLGLNKTEIVIGSHTGKAVIKDSISKLGYKYNDSQLDSIIDICRSLAIKKKNFLTVSELNKIFSSELGVQNEFMQKK
ncbi:MAG: hypothetical protein JXR64_08390 [Spirochaetales bacterium]|nr:hypothetical protein [Spirochaetales bacterium]